MYGLGERLKELREEKQISQKELSNKTGITQASIARYELNITEPKATEIKKLSEFFNKTSDYIFEHSQHGRYSGKTHKHKEQTAP